MKRWREYELFGMMAALALLIAAPGQAAAPAAPWEATDIGSPATPGTVDVNDQGVWTIKGSGTNIDGTAEDFYFVSQPIKDTGTIAVRLVRHQANSPNAGIMIRATKDPDSAHGSLMMTTSTVAWKRRPAAGESTLRTDGVNTNGTNRWLRLQRVGNGVTGFISTDGRTWRQGTPTETIELGETAHFGMGVTSRADALSTGTFDNVKVQEGVALPTDVQALGGDKAVLLQWTPVPGAENYVIARAAGGVTDPALFVPVTTQAITGGTFTDTSEGLANDQPYAYTVSAVFKDRAGNPVVSDPILIGRVAPTAVLPGFYGSTMNEGTRVGGVAYDAATGEITIRGSGADLWNAADGGYFMSQLVDGNFEITVTALTKPSNTDPWAKAGLMIRESPSPGSRDAYLVLTPANGLGLQWRDGTGMAAAWGGTPAIANADLTAPITIRLRREDNMITGEYSTDGGKTFEPASDPFEFTDPLPKAVYAGLTITSHNAARTSEAKFRDLVIKKL